MNRRRADAVVGLVVGAVLLVGSALSWRASQRQRALDGMMGSAMGPSMGSVHGTDPLWYVLGTVVAALVVGGGYLVVRDDLFASQPWARARENTVGDTAPEMMDLWGWD